MNNCSTSSPSSLSTKQEQEQNQENESQSIPTLTQIDSINTIPTPNETDQNHSDSINTIPTPNETDQNHSDSKKSSFNFSINDPLFSFISSKMKIVIDEWKRMSTEEKNSYIENAKKESKSDATDEQPQENKYNLLFLVDLKIKCFKAEWERMSEEEKKPYVEMAEKEANEEKSWIKSTHRQYGFFSVNPFLLFFNTKKNMIKDEWERMSEEKKKSYYEMAEKDEEERKRKEEERKRKEEEEENKSQDSSKPKFFFKFTAFKKTPFDFFHNSRKEMFKAEWDKMTEEEKKPYKEMAESEREASEDSSKPKFRYNINRKIPDYTPKPKFEMASGSNSKFSFSNQEKKQITFLSRPRSFYFFMSSKVKTIKDDWDKMTEEEKKPYEEMAEKEEEKKLKEEEKKTYNEKAEKEEEEKKLKEEEKKPYNEKAEKEEEEKKLKEEEKKPQEDAPTPRFAFKFGLFKKKPFDFFRDSQKEIFTAEWDKMTEEEKKPYEEMAEKEKEKKRIEEEEKRKAADAFIKNQPSKQTYKLVILGDGGVGKTSLVSVMRNGVCSENYRATLGVDISRITFQTSSNNPITFEIWDTAGQERYGGLRDGYYMDSDCMILMFDLTNPGSYRNVSSWHRDFTRRNEYVNVPWVLVGNKCDSKDRQIPSKRVTFHKNLARYFEISCKSKYHIEMPFLSIARRLRNDPNLNFRYS